MKNLLGKATAPKFWDDVREKDCYKEVRKQVFDIWEKSCESEPLKELRYSEYICYHKTGNRADYQTVYFRRRKALIACTFLTMMYPDEEKYSIRLMDELFAICNEFTWCLPPHQFKGCEQVNDDEIDLFAAETAFTLAEVYTITFDRLDLLIKHRIIAEIDRRIVVPYTSTNNCCKWERGKGNWVAVCNAGVAGAIMLMRPELMRVLMPRFLASIENHFLASYKDDGICEEGTSYWFYGYGFFTVFADMLKTFTDGEVNLFEHPKAKILATYIQKMFLSGSVGASFGDSSQRCNYQLGVIHRLKEEYPDEVLAYSPKHINFVDNNYRFDMFLRAAIWLNEEYYYNPDPDNTPLTYFADKTEWFVKKTTKYGFAAKGGNNAEMHNHNDVGTFIFAKNGRQMIIDKGAATYSSKYHNDYYRYQYVLSSSRGHAVPIIGGTCQSAGKSFCARGMKYENDTLSLDLAPAYPCAEIKEINRTFTFTEDSVTLADKFVLAGAGEIIERFPTKDEAKIVRDGLILADEAEIAYDPTVCTPKIVAETCVHENRTYNFIDLVLNEGVTEFTCTIS